MKGAATAPAAKAPLSCARLGKTRRLSEVSSRRSSIGEESGVSSWYARGHCTHEEARLVENRVGPLAALAALLLLLLLLGLLSLLLGRRLVGLLLGRRLLGLLLVIGGLLRGSLARESWTGLASWKTTQPSNARCADGESSCYACVIAHLGGSVRLRRGDRSRL